MLPKKNNTAGQIFLEIFGTSLLHRTIPGTLQTFCHPSLNTSHQDKEEMDRNVHRSMSLWYEGRFWLSIKSLFSERDTNGGIEDPTHISAPLPLLGFYKVGFPLEYYHWDSQAVLKLARLSGISLSPRSRKQWSKI